MKINAVGTWFLCYAVVPLLLLGVYILDRRAEAVTLTNSGGGGISSVSAAGDASGNPAVSRAGTLYVRGRVADTVNGLPVQNIVVSVDGINVGVAALSAGGWSFQMPAITLSVGSHSVTASTVGRGRVATLDEGKAITVTTEGGREIGSLDGAGDANGDGSVAQSGTLYVRGWAADTMSGAPVQSVTILIDGASVGKAVLNIARPDVADAYGRSGYAKSGWSFELPAAKLSLGRHSVTALVAGPSGTAPLPTSRTVTIQSAPR